MFTDTSKTVLGVWAPFRITKFEAHRFWDWTVYNVPATGHLVEPLDSRRTRATFVVPKWAAPYGLVCRRALLKIARHTESLSQAP